VCNLLGCFLGGRTAALSGDRSKNLEVIYVWPCGNLELFMVATSTGLHVLTMWNKITYGLIGSPVRIRVLRSRKMLYRGGSPKVNVTL
jgi:hypothetical protein